MTYEPSMAEVLRRLEELTSAMKDIPAEMRKDREAAAAIYVRTDLHDAQMRTLQREVDDIDERLDKADAFKRQIYSGASVFAIGILITMVLAFSNFMAVGGK